jgi:hypothetical protein
VAAVAGIEAPVNTAAALTSAIVNTNQIQFQVGGVPGFSYGIEASTNLVDWTSLQTNVSPFLFIDGPVKMFQQRFYRAVEIK